MKLRVIALLLVCVLLLAGCGQAPAVPAETTIPATSAPVTEAAETVPPETEPDIALEKEVIVYFANWYLDTNTAQEGAEVCSIPWEDVTYVNHAFWEIQPADGSKESSWERVLAHAEPRTQFRIASTLDRADFDDQTPSDMVEGLPRNHFAQYEYFSEKYPDVNILISIGGWTRSGFFSEMACTAEGRTSFVQSCMETLEQYPWLDGFDIDWEYFGGSRDGARFPEDDNDQGCPIWGTVEEDSENFAAVAKELREAMDAKYGPGVKKLSGCVSASIGWTLPQQNWSLVAPYMDLMNIMSYDMAGVWDHVTGHASREQHCRDAVSVMNGAHQVPLSRLTVGTPFYGTDLKIMAMPKDGKIVGAPVASVAPADYEITQEMIRAWEAEAVSGYAIDWVDGKPQKGESFDNGGVGWHFDYDEVQKGAYLYNDDPDSEFNMWYISYENPITLQQKLDYIQESGVAGIIIWECSQDTYDHQLISQIADNLLK